MELYHEEDDCWSMLELELDYGIEAGFVVSFKESFLIFGGRSDDGDINDVVKVDLNKSQV